jgi:hypothetical protein
MAKAKTKKTQNVSRATIDKQVGSLILDWEEYNRGCVAG